MNKRGFVILMALALALKMVGTALAEPLEYSMASTNAGHSVRTGDITVARFRFLLKELRDASGEQSKRIADMLVKGHESITKDYDNKITLLEFTETAYKNRLALLLVHINFQSFIASLLECSPRDFKQCHFGPSMH